MVTETGVDQTFARKLNNQMIMQLLKKKDMTSKELADELKISTAAISMITSELLKNNYILKRTEKNANKLGRSTIVFSLNPNFACVGLVGLYDKKIRIGISDMRGEIVYEREMKEVNFFDNATFLEIIIELKDVLQQKFSDIKLLGIEVSIPGKIDKNSGEIIMSHQFNAAFNHDKEYIQKLFAKYFNVPVKVNNDLKLSAIGEMYKGNIGEDVENALLLHVGVGIGGALIFNRKVYSGRRGFAGEIGMLSVLFNGEQYTFDGVCSLIGIKKYLQKKYNVDLSYKEIVQKYNEGDEIVHTHVNETARVMGKILKDLTEFLEFDEVIISGFAVDFGADYLEIVQSELDKSLNGTVAKYSALKDHASMIGAAQKATENLTATLF